MEIDAGGDDASASTAVKKDDIVGGVRSIALDVHAAIAGTVGEVYELFELRGSGTERVVAHHQFDRVITVARQGVAEPQALIGMESKGAPAQRAALAGERRPSVAVGQ